MLKGGTLFSGIGCAELAMPWADWRWCAEIDRFPSAVLAARFPNTPNLGDVTKVDWDAAEPIDLVVFGSPCQSFSVAGQRAGLDDPRGNLTLIGLAIVGRLRPRWVVWENVPGVLSIDGGRVFGAVLGALGQLGYGFAYRVLDAQHFGIPQRRRRVFVVGYLGDWRPAAAVLFERACLSGDPQARDEAGQEVAGSLGAGSKRSGQRVGRREAAAGQLVARSLNTHPNRSDGESESFIASDTVRSHPRPGSNSVGSIAHSLRADGFDASEDGTGRGTPLVFDWQSGGDARGLDPKDTAQLQRGQVPEVVFSGKGHGGDAGDAAPTLRAMGHSATAFDTTQVTSPWNYSNPQPGDPCHPLAAAGHAPAIAGAGVRRLTPLECERLQGLPDGHTAIAYRGKPAADGPRYKAIGNGMAVPVLRWIGERIQAVDALRKEAAA